MPKKKSTLTRRFGKKTFRSVPGRSGRGDFAKTRSGAERKAAKRRRAGWQVRIIKVKGGFRLFFRAPGVSRD